MKRVWNAPATGSGIDAGAFGRARPRARPARPPDRPRRPGLRRCGWPGRVPARRAAASTSSGFPPSTALMPVGSERAGGGHLAPAHGGERHGGVRRRAPRPPRRRPARRRSGRRRARRPAAAARAARRAAASSAVATTSGWVTAVSLISSASAVVPSRRRSRPVASDHRASVSSAAGSSSHGASMPGVWDPWPGASKAITARSKPGRGWSPECPGPHELGARALEVSSKTRVGDPGTPRSKDRRVVGSAQLRTCLLGPGCRGGAPRAPRCATPARRAGRPGGGR